MANHHSHYHHLPPCHLKDYARLFPAIRSDHSWRPTWTERKTGSCINYPNTSKKSPSSMTSVASITNTGRGKHRPRSAHINNTNSWTELAHVCLANTWSWLGFVPQWAEMPTFYLESVSAFSRSKAALASINNKTLMMLWEVFPIKILQICLSQLGFHGFGIVLNWVGFGSLSLLLLSLILMEGRKDDLPPRCCWYHRRVVPFWGLCVAVVTPLISRLRPLPESHRMNVNMSFFLS